MTKYIVCGSLVDATGSAPQKGKAIVVEGDKIKAIINASDVPAGSERVDLSDRTVLPGLIDCHEHLIVDPGDEAAQCAEPLPYLAMKAVWNAREILKAGITTMRDVGEKYFIDVEAKRCIDAGLIQGPRLLISGHPLIRTGGHAHFLGRETDGVSDMRKAVREQLKQGVDLIKIMASGGMSTKGSLPDSQEFSDDEIRACIDEARRNGRTVAAHLHGGPALKVCIEAGVHSVEHGILYTEDDVKLVAGSPTWLVFTTGVGMVAMESPDAPAYYKAKANAAHANGLKVRKWAKQHGVKVAVGTDTNHGRMDTEAVALLEAGWSPMEAIQACTIKGAELCGLAAKTGSLEAGKWADIIAVDGDPLSNMSNLRNVTFVMKAGKIEFSNKAGM
ncbi:amidohydrolase family protein [uncultured Bosea sp.]|uniref:metal-dependent hydrolase family protein n=1 Tax=uncultured Bosea sp. TaxID=211457 RepID=UPI0025E052D4|nr:amidohydrolase family protein [uncultured Bosea sp.]